MRGLCLSYISRYVVVPSSVIDQLTLSLWLCVKYSNGFINLMYNFKQGIMKNSFITTMLNTIAYLALIVQTILSFCYIAWPYEFEIEKNFHSGPNWVTAISYFAIGIITFLLLKSLAIIVKAAEKYLGQ